MIADGFSSAPFCILIFIRKEIICYEKFFGLACGYFRRRFQPHIMFVYIAFAGGNDYL